MISSVQGEYKKVCQTYCSDLIAFDAFIGVNQCKICRVTDSLFQKNQFKKAYGFDNRMFRKCKKCSSAFEAYNPVHSNPIQSNLKYSYCEAMFCRRYSVQTNVSILIKNIRLGNSESPV